MSQGIYMFTLLLTAGTLFAIFGLRALVASQGARAREAREDAFRELAAKATAVQADAAARLAGLQSELAGVATRIAAIETMLKSVE